MINWRQVLLASIAMLVSQIAITTARADSPASQTLTIPTTAETTSKLAASAIFESTNSAVSMPLKAGSLVLILGILLIGIRVLKRNRHGRSFDVMLDKYSVTTLQGEEAFNTKTRTEFEPPNQNTNRANIPTLVPTRSTLFPGIADKLDRARVSISAERWVTYWAISCLLIILGLTLLSNSLVIMATLALPIALFIQNSFLKSRIGARKREFEEQLADFLTIIASGLRAGLSFSQAVDSAVGDGSGEVERQVRRALVEVQIGSTLDAALTKVANKMDSDDLKWTIAALRIQREVGGNLSKILDAASATIRNRAELKREIRALSAEGRLSAYVLVALPIGIFGFLLLSRREYVQIFWTETVGMVMLAFFVILVTAGWFWIRSIVTVRV